MAGRRESNALPEPGGVSGHLAATTNHRHPRMLPPPAHHSREGGGPGEPKGATNG